MATTAVGTGQLSLVGLTKHFGPVVAVDSIDLEPIIKAHQTGGGTS